ncbi:LuxR C-terminal-related transcriptional regulator [Urechidicola croceus]|uniref:Helix-turn-helix transcriptional regulator n=1 Tax=Urechidicola croceus TaxID=1850246 RepID=A0A1D8P4U4_9FLAO|nr:LuxR C-terminal-related transcriptional regulator [Urechidicola croceus]AOW19531.1 helix-turn-helix transcriptional regulator [Urechidicola croceus]
MNDTLKSYEKVFTTNKTYDGSLVKKHIEKLKELDSYLPSIETFILVTNTSSQKYEFVSDNFEKTLGLDKEKMLSEGLPYYISHYHPDDLPNLMKILEDLMLFTMNETTIEERPNLSYSWNYRIRKGDGNYKNMHVHQTPIFFDINNKPIIGFSHNTVVGNGKAKPMVAICKKLNKKNEFETLFYKNYSKEILTDNLSNREIDTVRLLALGNTTKEISDKLNISEHTVSVHRKNILKKLNFNTTAEIIKYCNANHLF